MLDEQAAAHAPYLDAVATAISRAGLVITDHHADACDPRDGAIRLDAESTFAAFHGQEVTLAWDEERGWIYGSSREEDHGELSSIFGAGMGALPTPDEVATWALEIAAGTAPRYDVQRWRDFEDVYDGFEQQLRMYWPDT